MARIKDMAKKYWFELSLVGIAVAFAIGVYAYRVVVGACPFAMLGAWLSGLGLA